MIAMVKFKVNDLTSWIKITLAIIAVISLFAGAAYYMDQAEMFSPVEDNRYYDYSPQLDRFDSRF